MCWLMGVNSHFLHFFTVFDLDLPSDFELCLFSEELLCVLFGFGCSLGLILDFDQCFSGHPISLLLVFIKYRTKSILLSLSCVFNL